jgi:hypothetical protein
MSSPHLSPDELDSFMRKMLVSRISRRVLAEHHLALTDGLLGKENYNNTKNNVGIIFTGLSVKQSMDKFVKFFQERHHDARLADLAVLPEIVVDGDLDTSFHYIREHLEYVLLELLMNVRYSRPKVCSC